MRALMLLGLPLAIGAAGCVGADYLVDVDAGVGDLTQKLDFVRSTVEAGPRPDLTVLPDLFGFSEAPDPYQPGTPRLTIGVFYEGGSSEQIALGDSAHFYVYPAGETLAITSDSADKIEGYVSQDLKVAGGLGWFGCGVQWDAPHDLSAYKALHIALKSSSAGMSDVTIGMNSPTMASPTTKMSAKAYGYSNDGQWHRLTIPLADYAKASPALNPKSVGAPLVLTNSPTVKNDDLLKVDDVYFE